MSASRTMTTSLSLNPRTHSALDAPSTVIVVVGVVVAVVVADDVPVVVADVVTVDVIVDVTVDVC